MNDVLAGLVPLVILAAILVGGLVLGATRDPWTALLVLLDLLLAAALLRLSGTASWETIGASAAVVVLRAGAVALGRNAASRSSWAA